MGVNSTPTLYVNGRALIGALPFENFKPIIDEELVRRDYGISTIFPRAPGSITC